MLLAAVMDPLPRCFLRTDLLGPHGFCGSQQCRPLLPQDLNCPLANTVLLPTFHESVSQACGSEANLDQAWPPT